MGSDDERPEQFESDDSALDDELAAELAIDDATEPPVDAPSTVSITKGPRHSRHRSAEPDENLRAALERGLALTGPDGEPITADGEQENKPKRKKAPWWELPALAAFAILIAVLVKSFLIQPFYIPSQSMEKTLHGCPGCSGDRILVNKLIYDFRDPHPGDIVVFNAPNGWDDEPASVPPSNPVLRAVRGFGQLIGFVPPDGLVLVKRVIATGGQTVKGDADGNVYVSNDGPDGTFRKLNEPFVYEDGPDSHAQFGPVTVPKGRLWVMGDHRNDSADSRFHCDLAGSGTNTGAGCNPRTSTVPISDVIGKAIVIAWPPSRWRTLGTPTTFKHDAAAASAVAGGAVPVFGAAALTLPLWLVRRRRRRRGAQQRSGASGA
ncbi:MAG TPA: signal peptidase I [Jatrophihabitantaceae bacterium]|nr:signal peptidase I [Jatrophihabitantaceae bacterium]